MKASVNYWKLIWPIKVFLCFHYNTDRNAIIKTLVCFLLNSSHLCTLPISQICIQDKTTGNSLLQAQLLEIFWCVWQQTTMDGKRTTIQQREYVCVCVCVCVVMYWYLKIKKRKCDLQNTSLAILALSYQRSLDWDRTSNSFLWSDQPQGMGKVCFCVQWGVGTWKIYYLDA